MSRPGKYGTTIGPLSSSYTVERTRNLKKSCPLWNESTISGQRGSRQSNLVADNRELIRSRVNQYKKKITEWGLDRKSKESEIRAILRKRNQRAAVGKKSVFLIRGRIKEPKEIERYIKRKPLSVGAEQAQTAPTPPELECFTPIEIPTSPRTPEVFSVPESILIKLQDYLRASFDAETWLSESRTPNWVSVKGSKSQKAIRGLAECPKIACDLFDNGLWEEGRTMLATALAGIEETLRVQEPPLLYALFDLVERPISRRRPEIIVSILTQISDLAAIFFPTGHPIEYICRQLLSFEPAQLSNLAAVAIQSLADSLEDILGPTHYDTLTIRLASIRSVHDLTQEELIMRSLLRQCVAVHKADDFAAFVVQSNIADNLLHQKKWAEAESMGRDCVTCALRLTPSGPLKFYYCRTLRIMAIVQSELSQVDLAEANLRQAIKLSASEFGWSYPDTIEMILLLEGVLVRMGRHASAAEVKTLRQGIVHSAGVALESDLPKAHVERHTNQAWSAVILPDSTPFTLGIPVLRDDTPPSSI